MEQHSPAYIKASIDTEGNGSENYNCFSIKYIKEFEYQGSTSSEEDLLYHDGRRKISKERHREDASGGKDVLSKKREEQIEEGDSARGVDGGLDTFIKAWEEQTMIKKNDELLDLNLRLTQEMSNIKTRNLQLEGDLADLRLHVETLKRDLKQMAPTCAYEFEPCQDLTVSTTECTGYATGKKGIADMKVEPETKKSSPSEGTDFATQNSREDDSLLLAQSSLQTAPVHLLGYKHMRSVPDVALVATEASTKSCETCETIDSAAAAEANDKTSSAGVWPQRSGESYDPNRFRSSLLRNPTLLYEEPSTPETEDVSPDLDTSNVNTVSKFPVSGSSVLVGEKPTIAVPQFSDYDSMSNLPLPKADVYYSAEEDPLAISDIANQEKISHMEINGSEVRNSNLSKSSLALQSSASRKSWRQVESNRSGHLMDEVNLLKKSDSENLHATQKTCLTFRSFSSTKLNERMSLYMTEDAVDAATRRPIEGRHQETSSDNMVAVSPGRSSLDKQIRPSKHDSQTNQAFRDRQPHTSLGFGSSSLDKQGGSSKPDLHANQGLRDRHTSSFVGFEHRSFLNKQTAFSKSESHIVKVFRGRQSQSNLVSANRHSLNTQTTLSKPDIHASQHLLDRQSLSSRVYLKTFSDLDLSVCQDLKDGQSSTSRVSELASCNLAAKSPCSDSQSVLAASENAAELCLLKKTSSPFDSSDNEGTGKMYSVSKLEDELPAGNLVTCRSSTHQQVNTNMETSGLLDERNNCFPKDLKSNIDQQPPSTSLKKTSLNKLSDCPSEKVSLPTQKLSLISKAREYWAERDVSASMGGTATKQLPRSQNGTSVGHFSNPITFAPSCLPTVGPYLSLFHSSSETKETSSSEVGLFDSSSQMLDTAGRNLSSSETGTYSADAERYNLAEIPLEIPDAALKEGSLECTTNRSSPLTSTAGIQNNVTKTVSMDVEHAESVLQRHGVRAGTRGHGEDSLSDTCCTEPLQHILRDEYSGLVAPSAATCATATKVNAQKEEEFQKGVSFGKSSMGNNDSTCLEQHHQQLKTRSEDEDSTALFPECIFVEKVIYHPEADVMVPGTLRVTQEGCNKILNFKCSNVCLNFWQDLSQVCLLPVSSPYHVMWSSYQGKGPPLKTFHISFELSASAERLCSIMSWKQSNQDDKQFSQSATSTGGSLEQSVGHGFSSSTTSRSGDHSAADTDGDKGSGQSFSREVIQPESLISPELIDTTDRQCSSMPGPGVDVPQFHSLNTNDLILEPFCKSGTFVKQAKDFPTKDSDIHIAPSDEKNSLCLIQSPHEEMLHGHLSLYPKAGLPGTESLHISSRQPSTRDSYRFLYPCTLDILRHRVRDQLIELHSHAENRRPRSVSAHARSSRGDITPVSSSSAGSLPQDVSRLSYAASLRWETKFGSVPPHHKKPGVTNIRSTLRDPGLGHKKNFTHGVQHLSNNSKPRDFKYSSLKSTPHVSFGPKLHDVLHKVDDTMDERDAMDRLARHLKTSRPCAKTSNPLPQLRKTRKPAVCGPTAQLNQSSNSEPLCLKGSSTNFKSLWSRTAEGNDVDCFPSPPWDHVFTCKTQLMDVDALDTGKGGMPPQCADITEIKILRLKEPGVFKVVMVSGNRVCASHFICRHMFLHPLAKNCPSGQTNSTTLSSKRTKALSGTHEDDESKIVSFYHQSCFKLTGVENGKNTKITARPYDTAKPDYASRNYDRHSPKTYYKSTNKVSGPSSGYSHKLDTYQVCSRYLSIDLSSLGPGWRYRALDMSSKPMSMRHFVLIFASQKLANDFKAAFDRCRLESKTIQDSTALHSLKKSAAAWEGMQQDTNCSCVHVDAISWTPDSVTSEPVISSRVWWGFVEESSSKCLNESDVTKGDVLRLPQLDWFTSPSLSSSEAPLTKDSRSSSTLKNCSCSCCSVDDSQENTLHTDSEKPVNASTTVVTTVHLPVFICKKSLVPSAGARSSYSFYHEGDTCLVHRSKSVDNITCACKVKTDLEQRCHDDICRASDNFHNLSQVVKCSLGKGERKGRRMTYAGVARQVRLQVKGRDVDMGTVEKVGQTLSKLGEGCLSASQKNGPMKPDKAGAFLLSCRPALNTRTNVAGLKSELQVDSQILKSLGRSSVVAHRREGEDGAKHFVTEQVSCSCQANLDERYASMTEVFLERACSLCLDEDKESVASDDSYKSIDGNVNVVAGLTENDPKDVENAGRNSSPDNPKLTDSRRPTCTRRASRPPAEISPNQTDHTITGRDMPEHFSRVLGRNITGQAPNGDTKITQFQAAADSSLTSTCCKATQTQTLLEEHFYPPYLRTCCPAGRRGGHSGCRHCLSNGWLSTSACKDSDVQEKKQREQQQKSVQAHKADQASRCLSGGEGQKGCTREQWARANLERQEGRHEVLWAVQPTESMHADCCTSCAPSTPAADVDVATATRLSASSEQGKKGWPSEPQRRENSSAGNSAVPKANLLTADLTHPVVAARSHPKQVGRGASGASQPWWMPDEVYASGLSSSWVSIVRERDGAARLLVLQLKDNIVLCSRRIDSGLFIIPPATKPPGQVVRLVMSACDEGRLVKVVLWMRFRSVKMANQFIEVLHEEQKATHVNKNR